MVLEEVRQKKRCHWRELPPHAFKLSSDDASELRTDRCGRTDHAYYRLSDLGVPLFWETPLTSIWLFVRVMAVALMWRMSTWHGRWGSLVIGGASMAVGFVLIQPLGPSTSTVILGLALLGIGQGITYYSAIYYASRALGDGDVESAGKHEALIGAGYGFGPMIALCGLALGGGVAIGWSVIAVTGMASWPAIRPWRISKKSPTQSR